MELIQSVDPIIYYLIHHLAKTYGMLILEFL